MTQGGNLMSSSIDARITALIATTLHVEEEAVGREMSIASELGADSLDVVTLILAIEDEFHVDIHDEDAAEMLTVGQLIDYVKVALAFDEAPDERSVGLLASPPQPDRGSGSPRRF
jgi:acyl carrier protein